jgi:putative colanic acid biosynthesis acetyltransferase WcaF
MSQLDIAANRASRKWTRKELAGRALWTFAHPLFAASPRMFWGWRRGLLRLFGAKVGRNVHIFPTARIAIPWNLNIGDEAAIGDRAIIYNLGHITIGAQATISQGAHLCAGTHDHRRADMALVKAPISVGTGAWICAEAFVGPNVTICRNAIVGARAVAMKDIAENVVVAGNPARVISERWPASQARPSLQSRSQIAQREADEYE